MKKKADVYSAQMQLSRAQIKAMQHKHVPLHSCFCCMFTAVFTLGAGWKTLSCCAGGSDAYKGITTMGPQLSGRCLAMSRHVLARASISSWPVMKTKMSWDDGASCVEKTTRTCSATCVEKNAHSTRAGAREGRLLRGFYFMYH